MNPKRRELLGGTAGVLATGGKVASARALVLPVAPHPDTELLAACAEFDSWMQRYLATDFELAGNETLEARAEAARQARYLVAADPALDRICELRATTQQGLAARARSLALWDSELMKPGKVYEADRLMQAIVRDLIGAAA